MRDLTREEQVLLHLLQRSLHPETDLLPEKMLAQTDWKAVMDESAHQAVLLAAFDAAAVYKKFIPGQVWQEWFQRSSRALMSNLRVNKAQRELVALLEEKGFPYVILKGEVAAAYYPKPELRHLGDVDFLIDPAQRDVVIPTLEDCGYTNCGHDVGIHVAFRKNGASAEMHYDLPGVPYGEAGERVWEFMRGKDGMPPLIWSNEKGYRVPDPARHGLVLLLHMEKHMLSEGLGLRHLCDWAAFVDRTARETFWDRELLPLLKKIGLLHYAAVITKMCALCLGCVCPDWAVYGDEILCRAVLEDVLEGGNFGFKDSERKNVGMFLSYQGKSGTKFGAIRNLWNTLHTVTACRHPIVQKVPLLHPFFDVYRAGLYLVRTARGKRPSLAKLAPLAQERRSTYEQLRIFETDQVGE